MNELEKRMRKNFAKAKTKAVTVILDAKVESKSKKVASAKSYVTKYLLKNSNSTSVNTIEGIIEESDAAGVDAWRSCTKARGFSVLGRKGIIGLWREIRKTKNEYIFKADEETKRVLLICKGLKEVQLNDENKLLYKEEEIIERKGKRALVRAIQAASVNYMTFTKIVLEEEISITKVKESYTNKYGETKERVCGIEVNSKRLEKNVFELVDKLSSLSGIKETGGLITCYPSARASRCAEPASRSHNMFDNEIITEKEREEIEKERKKKLKEEITKELKKQEII